ncbi:hypothetical protein N7501_009699 [Penicillium viridicatum]|nr:hypothetical protein N7501_009699 [Penicillium viridicatum]
MDELMDIALDLPEIARNGNRVFAASHTYICNPLNKPHYPTDYTQYKNPDIAQIAGTSAIAGLGIPNRGL